MMEFSSIGSVTPAWCNGREGLGAWGGWKKYRENIWALRKHHLSLRLIIIAEPPIKKNN